MFFSVAVLTYQAIIFVTIYFSGFFSRSILNIVVFLWSLWTLVKITFFSPLMGLQFFTIICAYAMAHERIEASENKKLK